MDEKSYVSEFFETMSKTNQKVFLAVDRLRDGDTYVLTLSSWDGGTKISLDFTKPEWLIADELDRLRGIKAFQPLQEIPNSLLVYIMAYLAKIP